MGRQRFIFDNLIYYLEDRVLLLNLVNFRRQIINYDQLNSLIHFENDKGQRNSLKEQDKEIYQELVLKKQIIDSISVTTYDSKLQDDIIKTPSVFPVTEATFNITHSCNFACSYCYQNEYKFTPNYSGMMTRQEIDEVLFFLQENDKLAFSGEFEKIIISGGEPFLEELCDTVNYILGTVKTKNVTIFTNGTNILNNINTVDYSRIDEFQVSFDGLENVIRKVNKSNISWEVIAEGIDYLLNLNKKVTVPIVWTGELRNEIDDFTELVWERKWYQNPLFSLEINLANDYYNDALVNKKMYSWEELLEDRRNFQETLNKINTPFPINGEIDFLGSIIKRPRGEIIHARVKRCTISNGVPLVFEPNGEIHWCLCLGSNHSLIGNYKKGWVDERKIIEFDKRNIFNTDGCKDCQLRYICGGGCLLGNLGIGRKPLTAPACSIFKEAYFWDNLEEFITL